MADVKIIDIDSEQWNIKDQEARNKIANIEESNITKDLENITVNLKEGYEAEKIVFTDHYSYGKIHFSLVQFKNIKGFNIGTSETINIASLNVYPKKVTSFFMSDYKNRATLRCYVSPKGTLSIGESNGVIPGDNICFGQFIFAEA